MGYKIIREEVEKGQELTGGLPTTDNHNHHVQYSYTTLLVLYSDEADVDLASEVLYFLCISRCIVFSVYIYTY